MKKQNLNTSAPSDNYSELERMNKLVLSYLTVRKLIGVLGFSFP